MPDYAARNTAFLSEILVVEDEDDHDDLLEEYEEYLRLRKVGARKLEIEMIFLLDIIFDDWISSSPLELKKKQHEAINRFWKRKAKKLKEEKAEVKDVEAAHPELVACTGTKKETK